MQRILSTISILLILLGCGQKHKQRDLDKDDLFFQALVSPAFDEHAEVIILKIDSTQKIQFLLRDAYGNDKPSDTFYFKIIALSKNQLDSLNSVLIQKTFIRDSDKPKGMRDGIYLDFTMIHSTDTSHLALDNPFIGSSGYQITKNAFENFRRIFNDTIINNYLDDVESYIDNSKTGIRMTDNRPIDRLRKIKYSR